MLCAVEGGSVVGVVEVSIEPRDGRVRLPLAQLTDTL